MDPQMKQRIRVKGDHLDVYVEVSEKLGYLPGADCILGGLIQIVDSIVGLYRSKTFEKSVLKFHKLGEQITKEGEQELEKGEPPHGEWQAEYDLR